MQHPFSALQPEYTSMLATMKITRVSEIHAVAAKLLKPDIINRHIAVSQKTGVPALWYAVAFEREASSNFNLALGQGDPWNKKSVNVPRNMGPFKSWEDAAIFYTNYDKLADNAAPWTPAYACWKLEAWNGFGPRNHGRFSGYLWAGTNFYDPPTGKGGKYVSDGQWDPNKVDSQLGAIPVMTIMAQMRPDLAFGAIPAAPIFQVQEPSPVPAGVGGGKDLPDAQWIQHTINFLGYSPALVEDGNYGRRTRVAVTKFQLTNGLSPDGLAGPDTIAVLKKALEAEINAHQ